MICHGGMSRTKPSMNMTYQSGWLPDDTSHARYGPNSQIGLIWNRPASSAITRDTVTKKPPCLSAYRGNMRSPTTFELVRVGPGPLGVLLLEHQSQVDADQRKQSARDQQHMHDVEAAEDDLAGELATEDRRRQPGADHRDREHDRGGDAQAGAGESRRPAGSSR